MINDERWKCLGETERNEAYTTVQPKKAGLNWCGKDHSSVDEYACQFCAGIGYIDDDSTVATPCDVCGGSGHYEDICCDYHDEQEQING